MSRLRWSVLPSAAGVDRLAVPDAATRRELYFFDSYRVLQAVLLLGLCFSPLAAATITVVTPVTARIAAFAYLLGATTLWLQGRRSKGDRHRLVYLGLLLDLLAAFAALSAIRGLDSGIAALVLVTVSCASLLLPTRRAFVVAGLAAVMVLVAFVSQQSGGPGAWAEGSFFAVAYLAIAALLQVLRRQVRETEQQVRRKEVDLANLTQLNDLIVRRMHTGVMVVDSNDQLRRINEAAWLLLGRTSQTQGDLASIAPELALRLRLWRETGETDSAPVALAVGVPKVVLRFERLGGGDSQASLAFLDDPALLARQAERMTLSSLGRLSASIAHEIRNPLAAIVHAAQLLGESDSIDPSDQRLVSILRAQGARLNTVVENILQLSRRERSKPETVDLCAWAQGFVDEYCASQAMENDRLLAETPDQPLFARVDPDQLQQAVWNLVQNARRHGRKPGVAARVQLWVARGDRGAVRVEVRDQGPGVPAALLGRLFEPFCSGDEHGTGLGLYLARQLCEANLGALEHRTLPEGGSSFCITLRGVNEHDFAPQRDTKPVMPAA